MERQRLYDPHGQGGSAGGGVRSVARVLDAPKNTNPLFNLFMQAIDTGKTAVQAGAREYDRRMRGRMDDALLRTNAEFEQWKTEYMRTHQGMDALDAQQAFADKYQELSRKRLGEFGDQHYGKQLEREFVKYGMYAVKQGGAYQLQQDEAWQKSQWDAQVAGFQRIVRDNPNDPDMIGMEKDTLIRSWMAKNPGLDPGAMRAKLDEMDANGRLSSMFASQDFEGMEKLLGGGGTSGGITPGVSAGPRGNTIAEDFHNPLNLKKVGGGSGRAAFRQFADDAEGFRGAHHQLKLYYNRDGLKTPRQMIAKWAPSFENNHPEYFGTIKKHGIDIDAPIDMNDPKQAARLVKAMATHEGPLGKRYSFEQIEGFLRGQGGGTSAGQVGTANIPGLTSEQAAAWRHKVEAGRKQALEQEKKAQEQSLAANVQSLVLGNASLDPEQQKAAVYAEVNKITDPALRRKAVSFANSEMEFQKDLRKARSAAAIYGFVQDARAKRMTPTEAAQSVLSLNLNSEDTKKALEMYNGKLEENELNMRALSSLRLKIDRAVRDGASMGDEEIYRFAYDNRMTVPQLKEAFQYRDGGGNLGELKQSEVNGIWADLQGMRGERKKAEDAPAWLYGAARELLPAGKKPTRDEIRHAVSRAIVDGKAPGWFGLAASYKRGEAMMQGKGGKWEPEDEAEGKEDEFGY